MNLNPFSWFKSKEKARNFGIIPCSADLDYLERAIQRHTKGIDVWWKDNASKIMSFREMAYLVIVIWEMGRLESGKDTHSKHYRLARGGKKGDGK